MRRALLSLFLALPAAAQFSNTVYQTLVTGSTTSGTVNFGPVRNIGQAFHQATIIIGNRPGHTCDSTKIIFDITLIGSYQNSPTDASAAPIPQTVNEDFLRAPNAIITQGVATHPYIYVQTTFTDATSNCNYSVYYSGSPQTATPIDLTNPTMGKNQQVNQAAGSYLFFPGSTTNPGLDFRLYGLVASSTAAGTFSVQCNGVTLLTINVAANQPTVVFPATPIIDCGFGNDVTFVLAGGANMNYTVFFRTVHHFQF